MTHEHRKNAEAEGGPEFDHDLPDATSIEAFDDPADSDAPPLSSDLED